MDRLYDEKQLTSDYSRVPPAIHITEYLSEGTVIRPQKWRANTPTDT